MPPIMQVEPSTQPIPASSNASRPISPGLPNSAEGYEKLHYPWLQSAKPPGSASAKSAMSFDGIHPPPQSRQDRWNIKPGDYLAFALALDHVAERFPEDSSARDSVLAFPAGRYIGLVSGVSAYAPPDTEDPSQTITELVVHYAAREVPHVPEAACHWLPISGPGGLRTTVFFPFTDMRQWTTLGVRLRVVQCHESALRFSLGDDEFTRWEDAAQVHCAELMNIEGTGEPTMLQRWSVPSLPVPAYIWQDVRSGGDDGEPITFVEEIGSLAQLLETVYDEDHDVEDDLMEE